MAENNERDPDIPAVFDDSEDEGSFDGFEPRRSNNDSGSDVDLEGLEDDSGGPAPGGTDDEEEEARWTDHLSGFPITDFTAETGLNFNFPYIPKPLDYFVEFVDDDLWDLIVEETNRNAHQRLSNSPERLANFVPVTRAEIKAFFGVNIVTGIHSFPQLALYWSSDEYFGNQGIKKVMSKNRFEEISCYLNFSDSSVEPARGTPGFDRLYKIRRIFDSILGNCQTKFKPTKNLSVDEGMIGFRGRLSFRQYMPAKPTKYRIKVWMAADSSNGYVLNFDVYLGKEADGCRRIHGLGYDVVTKLIRPFMNRNHHVFFDNFFTSTKLLEHLEANDTYACGTVRSNRKDLPQCAKEKLRVGEKLVRQLGCQWYGN
ncbi:piggyBac transposable element-derived protein 4-like [Stylophora pistillata]|uniref:piggyBac transposable element-derived protein 4-like n=1 Tax=Stylophora pistillata TaxID=50429 RepID=UPI000C03F014|nr:piggyBac transposable element-derived protein 4-like [Stylophora pistillata]